MGIFIKISSTYSMCPAGVAETQAAKAATAERARNFIYLLVYTVSIGSRVIDEKKKCCIYFENDGINETIYMYFFYR